MQPNYSVGYGQRPVGSFLNLLRAHRVRVVADVRSSPFSRHHPSFSRHALRSLLEEDGLHYVFMGDELGGRPGDPGVYVDGRVDYARCRALPSFQAGLRRLVELSQEARVAIMCAEERPEECHRTKLVGEALAGLGVPLFHLDEHGNPCSHRSVIARLTGGQQTLFGPHAFTSRLRYEPSGS
jgi:uncharacterized protein (DUF488 family)